MLDVRGQLKRSATVPQTLRHITKFVTLHWNGPSVGSASDLALLQADARFHVDTRGWDGLSYHYAVGRAGALYQCRDHLVRAAHSGVTQGNNESLSVLIIHGEGDSVSPAQYDGLEALLRWTGIEPRYVLGHQEWPRATACPGALINRWLRAFRMKHSDAGPNTVKAFLAGVIRDEPDPLSLALGQLMPGAQLFGRWMLGKPVRGDSLWFEGTGWANDNDPQQYVHGSSLDTATYAKRTA